MGKVYKEYEVPIPKGKNIICHRTNGCRVEKVINSHTTTCNGNPSKSRILIGYVAGPTTMYPSSNYPKFYPDMWEKLTTNKVKSQPIISIGLKAVVGLIADNTELDCVLKSVFGTKDTNLMYDYTIFSLITKESSVVHFKSKMLDYAIFSDKLYSDSYFSQKMKSIT